MTAGDGRARGGGAGGAGAAVTASVVQADALDFLRSLPDGSADLVLTDPPYFRVKDEPWDRQWDNPAAFLAWVGHLCDEWRRVLAPNGSLYVFASPRMARQVGNEVADRFAILSDIVWRKPESNADRRHVAQLVEKDLARTWFDGTERLVLAEHYGADAAARGEGGVFLFASLLAYMREQFAASGLSRRDVDAHFGTANVTQYWLQERGFILPTAERYAELQRIAPGHFLWPYDSVAAEAQGLRQEYEARRRPFTVPPTGPCTAVWDFLPVPSYPGKHPCEKPLPLLEHAIASSSRPGALVLDCFAGSGATGVAALKLGRRFVGCDASAHWVAYARRRCAEHDAQPALALEAA